MPWPQTAVIYQIFIDRFSRGPARDRELAPDNTPVFCGGNLRGIIARLDYLSDLGVTALWLSPFNTGSAYHGYHITDFFGVDPRFGTNEELKELISRAHERGMKLLMDFVPNHMSSQHPYFVEAQKRSDSPYRKWFTFKKWPDDYLCFLQFKDLPKIDLEYAPARDHLVSAAKHWLGLGFDGLRLDHVFGPTHGFWRHFRTEIKSAFPDSVLIGEAYGVSGAHKITYQNLSTINLRSKFLLRLFQASDQAMRAYIGELDGALDFTFQALVRNYIARKSPLRPYWLLQMLLKLHYAKFPAGFLLPAFLDNHDINRFLFEAGGDKEKLKEAARLQFAQRQPVVIYQGTEAGMTQEKDIASIASYGDLQARAMVSWDKMDQELLAFYKDIIRQRLQSLP